MGFKASDLLQLASLSDVLRDEATDILVKQLTEVASDGSTGMGDPNNWKVEDNGSVLEITSSEDIPYAFIQDKGGKIRITDKMRKAMWALFYSTGKELYKAIALTKRSFITIKAKNYTSELELNESDFQRVNNLLNSL